MLSKSLIQFSVDMRGCVPSLLFDPRPKYGGGDEDNGSLLKRSIACTAAFSTPDPAALPPTDACAGDSDTHRQVWVSLCTVTAPFCFVCSVLLQNLHRTGETDSWRAQTKPCAHQDPGERSSDPKRD